MYLGWNNPILLYSFDIAKWLESRFTVFDIFAGNINSGIECTTSKFGDNTKLCGVVNMLEVKDAIQREHRLERWACADEFHFMKFNKPKCKALHLDRTNPKHEYILGGEWIGSSPKEKILGMLVM
ncbi:rna-directed dna polymerase from mobile element jockey-like [Willisornis vidua]|uniref:Rna-directed dna polymerase from mobile element jockey-like n=1 Tax=Willisornis vidua TaxID=1566151 RepID=A0ABQ9D3C2_9PASS|nr:rna-directed dna polymerase from mobile element jockey-like [Willisornis vidua]